MNEQILGIGSRVNHPAYGDGVIIRIFKAAYEVCFIKFGIKQVGKHRNERIGIRLVWRIAWGFSQYLGEFLNPNGLGACSRYRRQLLGIPCVCKVDGVRSGPVPLGDRLNPLRGGPGLVF